MLKNHFGIALSLASARINRSLRSCKILTLGNIVQTVPSLSRLMVEAPEESRTMLA